MKRIAFVLLFLAFCLTAFVAPQRMASTASAETRSNLSAATVQISNFQFTPKTLSVKVGTSVTWINKEGVHTVTADNGAFVSDNLTAGKSFNFTFKKPGTYRYHCTFHGSAGGGEMSGVIRVTR